MPHELAWGPLLDAGPLPLVLSARLADLRPRFLPKGQAGRGYRAVARNGRILLASDLPLDALVGRLARLRLQVWHKRILPADPLAPYGLLLCVRSEIGPAAEKVFEARLSRPAEVNAADPVALTLDVGGGMVLGFLPKG